MEYRGNKYRGENAQVLVDGLIHVPQIRPASRAILRRLMEAIDFCDRHISEYQTDVRDMLRKIKYVGGREILSGEELVALICT